MNNDNVVDLMARITNTETTEQDEQQEYEPTLEDFERFLLVSRFIRSKSLSKTAKIEVDTEFMNVYIDHYTTDENNNEMMLRTESTILFDWDVMADADTDDDMIPLTVIAVELQGLLEGLHRD